MTKDQAQRLSIISGGVLVAGTLLKHHYEKNQSSSQAGQVKSAVSLGRQVGPIILLIVVMVIMSDLIPDFAGPFALLIIVSYLATHMDLFNRFVKEQG